MGLKLTNNSISRLAANVAAVDTSITLTPGDGAKFPSLGAGDYFPATLVRGSDGAIEIVTVTARAIDTLTVTRAQESTTAKAFVAGDRVELRLTAGTFTNEISRIQTDNLTHAATSKATPVDADEIPLVDSAASFVLKKLTFANLKAAIFSVWGALISGGTDKATPVDADAIAIMDSAATNATKKLTWANIKATLKAYFDPMYWQITSNPTFRNKIINGGCLVAQRAAASIGNGQVLAYGGCDRIGVALWGFTTASGTLQQGASSIFSTGYGQNLVLTSTGSGSVYFATRLESKDTTKLNGKSVTVSCKVWHNTGATLNPVATISKANSVDNFSATTALASSASVSCPTSTPTIVKFTATLGATDGANGLEISVLFSGVGATSGAFFYIGEIQLEEGVVATPFEHRHYGSELSLCQRYFEIIYGVALATANTTYGMRVSKRTTPTLALLSLSAGSGFAVAPIDYGSFYQTVANSQASIFSVSATAEL